MTDLDPLTPDQSQIQSRLDEMMDEPVANPRYGRIAMRETVLKLMRPKKQYPLPEDAPDSELQLEL